MKSPFPGMDPYIEACGLWGDFHHDLISEIKHALARAAPERYLVRAEERSYIVLVEEEGGVALVRSDGHQPPDDAHREDREQQVDAAPPDAILENHPLGLKVMHGEKA